MNKVFAVGLNKTGTTSLHRAFEILGFRSAHYWTEEGRLGEIIADNARRDRPLLTGIDHYEALTDWVDRYTAPLFRRLDEQYPDSRFVLTTRDLESWLASRERHVNRMPNIDALRRQFPENPWYNLDIDFWRKQYHDHYAAVRLYFEGRPNLLEVDLIETPGWPALCDLLERPIPDEAFPFENRSEDR